jgi:hypothetical protein
MPCQSDGPGCRLAADRARCYPLRRSRVAGWPRRGVVVLPTAAAALEGVYHRSRRPTKTRGRRAHGCAPITSATGTSRMRKSRAIVSWSRPARESDPTTSSGGSSLHALSALSSPEHFFPEGQRSPRIATALAIETHPCSRTRRGCGRRSWCMGSQTLNRLGSQSTRTDDPSRIPLHRQLQTVRSFGFRGTRREPMQAERKIGLTCLPFTLRSRRCGRSRRRVRHLGRTDLALSLPRLFPKTPATAP